MQEAWLFIIFPDTFENISSRKDKRLLRDGFKDRVPGLPTQDIDADLLEIRKHLSRSEGDGFSFYRSPIVEQWRTNRKQVKSDGDGAPVVELSPLVRVAPPSPGADEEAFLLDGPAKRGARAVAWPREFERFDDTLWQFLDDQTSLGERSEKVEIQDAPYRGLASFGPSDAAMFFGREREVEAVVNRLRVQPLIAVVGPSGVGKSSFVHAGVVPALPDTWQTLSLRPGTMPLAAVEARLGSAGITATGLADRLRADPNELARLLDEAAHRQGTHLVVVIDQLEEIFTQCRDVAVRDRFALALTAIPHRAAMNHRDCRSKRYAANPTFARAPNPHANMNVNSPPAHDQPRSRRSRYVNTLLTA